jgi:hypothetical protein
MLFQIYKGQGCAGGKVRSIVAPAHPLAPAPTTRTCRPPAHPPTP